MERFVEADGRADLMNIREKQEQTEMELLSPYATQSIRTKGRKKPEDYLSVQHRLILQERYMKVLLMVQTIVSSAWKRLDTM